MTSFYIERNGAFESTPLTRGPWSFEHQHGGPPSALMVRTCAARVPGSRLARATIEMLRPIPVATLRVEVEPLETGKKVQRMAVRLLSDELVARGALLFVRALAQEATPAARPVVPPPSAIPTFEFPFFAWDVGYHRAVEVRIAEGAWGTTPITAWARATVPLVEGEVMTPLEQLMVLADAESGIGPPVDVRRFTFLNPDLNVHLARVPEGPYVGMQVRSWTGGDGAGIAASVLFDERGLVGRASQSCVIEAR